jgi:poly(3-hydroxybutyrate) depolymerase
MTTSQEIALAALFAGACHIPDPATVWQDDEPADFDASAPAAPRAYSGDTCPDVVADADDFESDGLSRSYELFLPDAPQGAGLLFLFHGVGQPAPSFARRIEAAQIAADHGLVVVVPEDANAGISLVWGTPPNDPRHDVVFFDDMVTCFSEQLAIDLDRVYVSGFSAGGVWASWLTMHRSTYLAASVIFSGGVDQLVGGEHTVNPYQAPTWNIPVLLVHGGVHDKVVVDFANGTYAMTDQLRDDGHTAIRCPHLQGHDLPSGHEAWSWPFLLGHTFGMSPSPYVESDPSGLLPSNCDWDDSWMFSPPE